MLPKKGEIMKHAKTKSGSPQANGYSLLELSIVLIIIGLISLGILKGRHLIQAAKIRSLVTQLNDIHLATHLFEERYGYLPGDYPDARNILDPDLFPGNGNGRITGDGLSQNPAEKSVQFWSHLAAAHIMPSQGPLIQHEIHFGRGVPKCKIGGGITAELSPFPDTPGLWFIVGKRIGTRNLGALFTPGEAQQILKAFATEDPTQGALRVKEGQGVAPGTCLKQRRLNLATTTPACILLMQY